MSLRRVPARPAGRAHFRRLPLIRPQLETTLRLHDGRRLGMAEFGSRAALPIIYCHGFLGSRLEPGTIEGLQANTIAFDRPGYGRSDLQRLPSLRGWGADIAEGLVQLGVGQCLVVGVSTGAPYALALASVLGPRVRRLIIAGGIAGPEMLETGGGTALALSLLGRGSRTGRLLHRFLRMALATRLDRRLLSMVVASERSALERLGLETDILHARLLQSLRAGNRRGLRGAMADARLVSQPWDFTCDEIDVDVQILHGAQDPVVPPSHAHWYAAHLPKGRLEILPGELHLSLCFKSAAVIQSAVRELATVRPETVPKPALTSPDLASGAARG